MSSLKDAVSEALAYDEHILREADGNFANGMAYERARTRAIDNLVPELVEALEDCDEWFQDHFGYDGEEPMGATHQEVYLVLAKLRAALESDTESNNKGEK